MVAEKPVFLQGLWRAQTTYWWSKFREDPDNKCFNEPLHPNLDHHAKNEHRPRKSLSNPELDKPSFAEYPDDVRISPEWAVKQYYISPGESAPELECYINELMSLQGRPVFKFNRATLKAEWIKNKFDGSHIYLHRDLSSLMRSYYSFRGSNSYYLSEFLIIIGTNAETELFHELADYLQLPHIDDKYRELRTYYRTLARANFQEGLYGRQTMVDMVGFFSDLSLTLAYRYADIIINPLLLKDQENRDKLQEQIVLLTGTVVDISDYLYKEPPRSKEVVSENVKPIIQRARGLL